MHYQFINHIMKRMLGAVIILFPILLSSQVTLDRSVLGAAGMDGNVSGNVNVSATLGETVVFSSSNPPFDFTQGFQQSDDVVLDLPLMFSAELTRTQCPDIHNGIIEVYPTGCKANYSVTLTRVGDSLPLEVITDVKSADKATFMNLDSGHYQVTVHGANLCTTDSIYRMDLEYEDCDVDIYTGITPNGDEKNDFWIISNIESNQPNEVRIFSRWGTMVWKTENYDNKLNVWNGQSTGGTNLPDGTYFYVIEIPDNPDASGSGWIQLTR